MNKFSTKFEACFNSLIGIEGGYSNKESDKGGETYCGISRRWYPDWKGWEIIDKIKQINPEALYDEEYMKNNQDLNYLVKQFYYEEYWLPLKCEKMPYSLAFELFEMAVNIGKHLTVIYFQQAINVLSDANLLVDGIIGNKTLSALNKIDDKIDDKIEYIIKILNIYQGMHYISICQEDESQKVNLIGWLTRVKC